MRTNRIRRLGVIGLLAAFVGCGAAEPMQQNPNPEDPQNPDRPNTFRLEIVGWQSRVVSPGEQVALQVKYSKNGAPAPDATITFGIVGDMKDSTLLRGAGQTNAAGVAETIVHAGQIAGQIRVEARADQATPVEWLVDINVTTPPPPPVNRLAGVMSVTSNFNVETPFEGTKVGEALNTLNAISDDPDDPGKFVVDKVLERITDKTIAAIANFLRPALNAEVNNLLTSISPAFVNGMKKLARDISTVARRFEVASLVVSAQPQSSDKPMLVDHQLTHIAWEIDGRRTQYSFSELGMDSPRANGVQIIPNHAAPGHLITEHSFPLQYGAFLVVAINELVIPNIDQNAHSIGDLLNSFVKCGDVGKTMNHTVGVGGDALWAAACTSAMNILGGYLEDRIVSIDDEDSELNLTGQAIFLDNNQDAHFDVVNGTWNGTFSLGKAVAPLDPTKNSFSGLRTQ